MHEIHLAENSIQSFKDYSQTGNLKLESHFSNTPHPATKKITANVFENNFLVYSGGYSNNEPNGYGTEFFGSGTKWYEGNFRLGKRDAHGTLFNEDGTKLYEGLWCENLFHGKGKKYYDNWNVQLKGVFKYGEKFFKGIGMVIFGFNLE
jgi:antitoxin component YwqK of YwqJK toxin-antitoxin module